MTDIEKQLSSVNREIGKKHIAAGDGRTVRLRRTYAANVDEVWAALTEPERITRWFLPVTIDRRVGGRFQIEGNLHGSVQRCESLRLLTLEWVIGTSPGSEVEVRLSTDGGGTLLELDHTALTDERFWAEFGPGATGVGWDLALLSLHLHLTGDAVVVNDPDAGQHLPEFKRVVELSSLAWGEALAASGATPAQVTTAVEHTAALYAPPARMFATRNWMRASRASFLRHFVAPAGSRH